MSSQFSLRTRRNEFGQRRGLFTGFDHWLSGAVIGLLGLGIALVYSSTRQWFASNGLDPQYYLKRHIINIIIGLLLAFGLNQDPILSSYSLLHVQRFLLAILQFSLSIFYCQWLSIDQS